MRNRFEDVRMGHKILTSAVDGIKSHFKTSYGLTVKLLETKSIEECRALIERGFGAYLLQKRVLKKERNEKVEIEMYRTILQKYTLKGARDYLKIARRLEKERRNEEFLIQKMIETDAELVQAIADYMPLGIGHIEPYLDLSPSYSIRNYPLNPLLMNPLSTQPEINHPFTVI